MLTLSTPLVVGDLNHRVTVNRLQIVAVSINLQQSHIDQGVGILSIILQDPDSGHQFNVPFRDASVLKFLAGIKPQLLALLQPIWQALVSQKKIPAGALTVDVPQEAALDAAIAGPQPAP